MSYIKLLQTNQRVADIGVPNKPNAATKNTKFIESAKILMINKLPPFSNESSQ